MVTQNDQVGYVRRMQQDEADCRLRFKFKWDSTKFLDYRDPTVIRFSRDDLYRDIFDPFGCKPQRVITRFPYASPEN